MPYEKCKDCGKTGHVSSKSKFCGIQGHTSKPYSPKIIQIWVKKSKKHLYNIVETNNSGPKVNWGPKIKI